MMSRSIILLLFLLLGGAVSRAQTPGLADRRSLVEASDLILIGMVEDQAMVANRDKMMIDPEAIAEALSRVPRQPLSLPNPAEYRLGTVYHIRVTEVLKGGQGTETGSTIHIFVPGSAREGTPVLIQKEEFLVLLSKFQGDEKKLRKATIYRAGETSEKVISFDPKSSYVVVGDHYGVIQLSQENHQLIDEIRDRIRRLR